jgi:hypothetical protein
MTGALLAGNGVFDVSLGAAQLHFQRWTGAPTPSSIDGFREARPILALQYTVHSITAFGAGAGS